MNVVKESNCEHIVLMFDCSHDCEITKPYNKNSDYWLHVLSFKCFYKKKKLSYVVRKCSDHPIKRIQLRTQRDIVSIYP
jgi:hypothetical protein